jgi:hypothetical protein
MGSVGSHRTPDRVAHNDALFRKANETIREKANECEIDGLLRALCECADTNCRALLYLTHRQYEDIRANPRWFINAPGHHVNEDGSVRIVAEHHRYVIVEKVGEAGEVVEQLDPRAKRTERSR